MLDQFSMQMLLLSSTRQFLLTDDASQYQGFIVQKNILEGLLQGTFFWQKLQYFQKHDVHLTKVLVV